jgi:hypothetical protein
VKSVTHTSHERAYGFCVTISRLISYPTHGAFEILVGAGIMAVPFVIGLTTPAVITAVVIGAVLFGLGISATDTGERGTLPISAHAAYDAGIALGLTLVGIVFGIAGSGPALAFFVVAGLIELVLASLTRYTPAPASY